MQDPIKTLIKRLQEKYKLPSSNTLSEQAQLEEAVAQLEKVNKALQEVHDIAQLGTFVFDDNTDLFETSPIADAILGIDASFRKDIQGWISFVHPDDYKKVQTLFDNNKVLVTSQEFRIIRPQDKKTIWILGHAKKKFDANGVRSKITGTLKEITQRKTVELNLIKSEKAFKLQKTSLTNILQGTNAGTWDWHIETNALEINNRWAEIMGYTLEELEPIDVNTWSDNVHPDDLPKATEILDKLFNKELDYYDVDFRQPHKKGHWIWVNARGKVTKWSPKGKALRVSGTHLDITERKTAEEKIVQSDAILKRINSLVFVVNKKGDVIYASDSVKDILGYDPKEMLGQGWWKKTFDDSKHSDSVKNKAFDHIYKDKALNQGILLRKIKTKTGGYKWIEWHLSKGIDNTYISVGVDVTLRQTEELTKQVIYNITKKANESTNTKLLYSFIKEELDKLINTDNFFIALYDKTTELISTPFMVDEQDDGSDFPKGKTLTGYLIDSKKSLLANRTTLTKLKRAKKIEVIGPISKCWVGIPLLINNNAIGAIVLQSYTDENAYTQKDVALLELVASNISKVIKQSRDFEQIQLLNQALIQSPEAVFVTDLEGNIVFLNPAIIKMSGYSKKELLGSNPRILKSGEQPNKMYQELWQTITRGKTWVGEFINKHKDGSHYLVAANISAVKNKQGEITHYIAVEEDITEKRKLEHDFIYAFVEAQEIEKQAFGEDLHDGISQILAAESMFIDVLIKQNQDRINDKTKHLIKIKELNLSAINEARNIAHGLLSIQLKQNGLLESVNFICLDYNVTKKIHFSYSCTNTKETEITDDIKTNVYRIVQEICTNIQRHSLATKATINISKTRKNQLKLVIKDNGVGLDSSKEKGTGFKNMERRIFLLKGTMKIDSSPNKGTCFTILVPLRNIQ